jgi:hypothetical protein
MTRLRGAGPGRDEVHVEPHGELHAEVHKDRMLQAMRELRGHLQAPGTAPDEGRPTAPSAGAAALDGVVRAFGLSPFESRLLVLSAAVELDGEFPALCAAAQGDPRRTFPTFGLALATLPDPHWSALAPSAPLRFWKLIEVRARGALHREALVACPIQIDERVLHHLLGVSTLDERLQPLLHPWHSIRGLASRQGEAVQRVVGIWSTFGTNKETTPGGGDAAVVQLHGPDAAACREVAGRAAGSRGAALHILPADQIPGAAEERETFCRLWQRERTLEGRTLLVDAFHLRGEEGLARVADLARRLGPGTLVMSREPLSLPGVESLRVEVPIPSPGEQEAQWGEVLGEAGVGLNGAVRRVTHHFRMGLDGMRAVGTRLHAERQTRGGTVPEGALWDACRAQARPRLDDLAQRIEPGAGWDHLVLPRAQREVLQQMAAGVAQRVGVHEEWGFGGTGARGSGITALFAGASGTGKTMAAEVLAGELKLDLFRVDLSQVVSKYIGETEKNLSRVFDAAEEGGAILLFDEADALFGKRSEVRDSHDRYANIEVSYLLQRMEAYQGLAILTTNLRGALDPAFLRRIRYLVQFPFPGRAERTEIWRRVFPPEAPTEGLDPERLGRLTAAGGNIRNIALNGAFLAAAANEPIRMGHLLQAARAEYAKLEKPLLQGEVDGWT